MLMEQTVFDCGPGAWHNSSIVVTLINTGQCLRAGCNLSFDQSVLRKAGEWIYDSAKRTELDPNHSYH